MVGKAALPTTSEAGERISRRGSAMHGIRLGFRLPVFFLRTTPAAVKERNSEYERHSIYSPRRGANVYAPAETSRHLPDSNFI